MHHCVLCARVKKGQRQFTYHLYSIITETKTNMLLITFLGLFAKLAMVSDACVDGTQDVKNFNFLKAGISVLT